MTSCQIAFAYKNRVVCLEEFPVNTPNVLQKMKIAVWRHLPMDNIDRQDIVLETMCAGSLVSIKSDQDAAKYIFGCAVDGKAKIRVKTARKAKVAKEKNDKDPETTGVLDMTACAFVDQEFIRRVVDLLDSWADMEISYEDTYAMIEALKNSVLAREPLASFVQIPARFLDGSQKRNWTVPSMLCKSCDDWVSRASQEQLLFVVEQLPTILDKLVSRRGKLFEDVFVKQKTIKQILKLRLPKSKRIASDEQKEHRSFRKQLRSIGKDGKEFEVLNELKQDTRQLQKPAKRHDHRSYVSVEKGETGTETESERDHVAEKEHKRQARIAKRMEKFGCKTIEELNTLESVKKEAQLARALEKYGCATEEELKQVKLEKRLAKKLERYGCQNEEELKQAKLAAKLEKYGCHTIEEYNDLKKQTKLSKSKPSQVIW